jgi:hypothetical protein
MVMIVYLFNTSYGNTCGDDATSTTTCNDTRRYASLLQRKQHTDVIHPHKATSTQQQSSSADGMSHLRKELNFPLYVELVRPEYTFKAL